MAKHKYKDKLRQGACAYCGIYKKDLSEEHVIPKCLFSGHPPPGTPVVYACKECNNKKKSRDDAYLRDYLVKDMELNGRSITPSLLEAYERAKEKNHSKFVHDIKWQPMPLFTPTGLFRGFTFVESIPSERMKATLRTIVRGLCYAYTGKRLSRMIHLDVYRFPDLNQSLPYMQDLIQKGGQLVAVGDGKVFECLYGMVEALPSQSIWWLFFNRTSLFGIGTNRENLLTNF